MKNLFRALVAVCAMSMAGEGGAGVNVSNKVWRQLTEFERGARSCQNRSATGPCFYVNSSIS